MPVSSLRRLRARADVGWTVLAFFALQIAFVLTIDLWRPGWWDPENELRLQLLSERTRERPEQPALVIVGSSRIVAGFLAAEVPTLRTADGRTALPFNYSHLQAGPRMNLMNVRRLLQEGFTPEWLVLEVVPACLVHERPPAEWAAARDVPALCRHSAWTQVLPVYSRIRLNPFYNHRQTVLAHLAPPLVTRADRSDDIRLLPLGDDDDWFRRGERTEEERTRLTAQSREVLFDRHQDFHMDPLQDGSICETLDICRKHNIAVVLLLTPENSEYRSWYSAETERRLHAYLKQVQGRYGVPCVDARDWVGDEGFNDANHLRLKGARVFTERLSREVLQPLVAGSRVGPDVPIANVSGRDAFIAPAGTVR